MLRVIAGQGLRRWERQEQSPRRKVYRAEGPLDATQATGLQPRAVCQPPHPGVRYTESSAHNTEAGVLGS